jgi:DNA-binding transcriptional LysR family regulator
MTLYADKRFLQIETIGPMNIRKLDLNLLLLLDGLLTTGNLSAVARKLSMSQPRASAGLSTLRYFFKNDLFVRTGRGLRPTPFAQGLALPIREIIDKVNHEILVKPSFDPQRTDRVFTLTMQDIGEVIFLPPLIQALHARAPHACLRCLSLPYSGLNAALEEGVTDLAIGYFPDLTEPATFSQQLFDHPFACIVRQDHPDVGDSLTLEQFLALEHLVVAQEGRSQEIFENRILELNLKRRILLQVPHFMSVPRLIAGTDMISVVPFSLATWFARTFGLRIVAPPVEVPLIPLKQFWHRRMHEDPAVTWLRSLVAEQLVNRDPSEAMSPTYGTLGANATAPLPTRPRTPVSTH